MTDVIENMIGKRGFDPSNQSDSLLKEGRKKQWKGDVIGRIEVNGFKRYT